MIFFKKYDVENLYRSNIVFLDQNYIFILVFLFGIEMALLAKSLFAIFRIVFVKYCFQKQGLFILLNDIYKLFLIEYLKKSNIVKKLSSQSSFYS